MRKEIMQGITIKSAKSKDLEFILKGIKEICKIEKQKPEKEIVLIKNIRRAIKNKKIIVAEINKKTKKTIGFIEFTFSSKEPYGLDYGKRQKFCWIEWMYVKKDFRRKGIGHLMHQNIISICRKNNIKEIMLDVFEINKKAKKFYEKEKFSNLIHIREEKL